MKSLIVILLSFFVFFGALAENANSAQRPKGMILTNLGTGKILYEYNADVPLAPASLTKIMTMYLVMDAIKAKKLALNQKILIPAEAAKIGGSNMKLYAGEKVPVVRLLAGTAVTSGNDSATALAMRLGGPKFVDMMNAKAARLGMKNTRFKNPTGLPAAGHKSTARDLMILSKSYLKTHPQAARFHSMTFFMHKGSVAKNTNSLLGRVAGVDGLKTGWTVASGYNLIVTASRGTTKLMAIVLGCQNKEIRDEMAIGLLEAGFRYPNNPAKIKNLFNSR